MIKSFFISALRNLARNKVLTALNVAGLSIGVAVCLVIGIWLRQEISFDRFHPNGDKIFRLANTFKSESESFSQALSGPAFGAQLPKELPTVVSACRTFNDTYKLNYRDRQFNEAEALDVDSNFFSFFGFKLKYGNPDEVLRSANRIVLTEDLAKKYFGDEDPIGKVLLLDGQYAMTVSGIAENPPVHSHIRFDLLVPVALMKKINMERYNFNIDEGWLGGWPMTYVQLNDPKNKSGIEKQINEVAARFSEKEWKENKMSYAYFLQPLKNIHLESNLRYDSGNNGSLARVKLFSVVGIIVLLLACINYINLTTAGTINRVKEIFVRKVTGATRIQLVRQFFTETLIICAVSVLIGVSLAKLVLPAFSSFLGQSYAFPFSGFNVFVVLAFIILVSIIAGVYPSSILSSFNPSASLKGVFIKSKRGNNIRRGLIVFQFTITIALVASIFIINSQMNFIKNKGLGFDGNAVVEVRFYGDSSVINHYAALRNRLLGNPYILNISKHGQNVVGGMGNGWTTTEDLSGQEISTSLYRMAVDTSYFNTYDMQLATGRFFSADIPTDSTKAVIVNEAAVRTFGWKTPQNAIGKRFGKGDDTRYVIGVVRDFNFESLHKPVEALMIVQTRRGGRLSVKIDGRHTNEAIRHLETTWRSAFPEIPLEYGFVDESITQQYGDEQKMQGVFSGFAGLSLLIACIGLFGLSIFVVERKVKEIGIRKVLGASVAGIVGLLSWDFLKLVIISAIIAAPVSFYFMNSWLQDFAYHIRIGWWIFVVSGVIALAIAWATVSFRAVRAAIANPVKSLRTE